MLYFVASDLHYGLPQMEWIDAQADDYDAVVLAGDHLDVVGRAEVNAQIALFRAYFARLAERTIVIANSGNHDLNARRDDGEKHAEWMADLDPRIMTDGRSEMIGSDLVSVCAWWEGPRSRAEVESQLERDGRRDRPGPWIWAYHAPPDRSPTSWSGSRHFGDTVLNELIERHGPDLVITGHVHEAPFRADGSWIDRLGDTVVVNAGRQTGPIPAHLVVDSDQRTVTWWSSEGEATANW